MIINDFTTALIYLLVGISILLVGMRMMSNGLKRSIGPGMRKFFKKTENNPSVSLGIGIAVTASIQSSDATNSMVIGFINAKTMKLFQGLCIMLGAYIGTTITGILASFSSLSFSLYFLLLAFIGVVLTFFKNETITNLGDVLTGLGLLFFGLAVMKAGFKQELIVNSIQNIFESINYGPLLYLIGFVLTALVQSSSAVTSIIIAMIGASSISLGSGLYIVLGAMVGTVVTTLLASINGSTDGKRAAVIAFTIRLITTLIAMLLVCIFENQIANGLHIFAVNNSDELPLALFTVIFNVVFMPLCIPLLKPLIKLFTQLIKDKDNEKLKSSALYLDDKFLNTPSIAELQVKNEILNMYDLASLNYSLGLKRILSGKNTNDDEIEETEKKIDYLNNRIAEYLIKLSPKVNIKDEKRVGTFYHVINDIERIGDHAYNFYESSKEMIDNDLAFSKEAIKEINKFNDIILKMIDLSKQIFNNKDKTLLKDLHDLENKTDELKRIFSNNHFERIKTNKCKYELSAYYTNLLVELERIADHLNNIGYSITNPVGDDI